MNRWDKYFYDMCVTASSKSPCLSRKIGALLVRDRSIVSIGFNGPPRGVPHCGHERFMKDMNLSIQLDVELADKKRIDILDFKTKCPRQVLGYESGTHMELCPAQHAEENALSNAARNGVSVLGCTLYMNSIIPCQKCYGTLINAGVAEIVVEEVKVYDKYTQYLIDNSNVKIRKLDIYE